MADTANSEAAARVVGAAVGEILDTIPAGQFLPNEPAAGKFVVAAAVAVAVAFSCFCF